MSNIIISGAKHDTFKFSGGEIQVKINDGYHFEGEDIGITARIKSPDDLVELSLVCNALQPFGKEIAVLMPYLPYARQDRRCVSGEAHGVSYILNYINSLAGVVAVYVLDLHSDVALVDPLISEVTQDRILESYHYEFSDYKTLVSPDAGSLKKIYKAAKALGITDIVKADKVRDTATGEILATEVHGGSLEGKNVLIVDDICDGGRTFIELSKVLKDKGAERVGLYVTHGIFSKGLTPLIESGIDELFTTDSWNTGNKSYASTTVFPIVEAISG